MGRIALKTKRSSRPERLKAGPGWGSGVQWAALKSGPNAHYGFPDRQFSGVNYFCNDEKGMKNCQKFYNVVYVYLI